MIVVESRTVRRFVGRIERGEEVVATLRQLCERERICAAWIRGAGILEWVELAEWDADREAWAAPRRIEGLLTLTSLQGNVAIRNGPLGIQLWASLVRPRGAAFEALGGAVSAARAHALEFAIDVFDDVRLERDEDISTAPSSVKGTSVPGVPVSWADVAAASERAERATSRSSSRRAPAAPGAPHLPPPIPERDRDREAEALFSEPVPQRGDWVDHRQFGRCSVEGEDEDGGLRIRLPSGVRKVIKLDVLEVLPPRYDGERRIYPLRPRRR